MKIQGKLALVTGASSGIGEIVAREIARKGGRVVLAARSAFDPKRNVSPPCAFGEADTSSTSVP